MAIKITIDNIDVSLKSRDSIDSRNSAIGVASVYRIPIIKCAPPLVRVISMLITSLNHTRAHNTITSMASRKRTKK